MLETDFIYKFEKFSEYIEVENGKRNLLIEQIAELDSEISKKEKEEKKLEEVVILLQKVAEFARNQAKNQIEEIVTRCLQYILENDSSFFIDFSESRNLPIAQFYTVSQFSDYIVKTKPENSKGGGVIDIISLALRIAFLELFEPKIQGPLLLDEPGKHISSDYVYNFGEFIRECSLLFDRQIIMITHNDYLSQICDVSFNVEIKNGISYVTKIEKEEI